jgi:hypothetical protein
MRRSTDRAARTAPRERREAPEIRLRESSRALESRLADIGDSIADANRDLVNGLDALDPERLSDAATSSGRAELRAALVHLRKGSADPAKLTDEGEELARAWARDGAPVGALIAICRLWHGALADAWHEWAEGNEAPPEAMSGLLRAGQRFWFHYFAGLASLLAGAYTTQADALRKSRSQRQLRLVQELLESKIDVAPALAYDLSRWHTALVAWGPAAAKTGSWLRAELDRNVLVVAVGDDLVWGWIGGTAGPDRAVLRRLERRLGTSGASIAFGPGGAGVEGFRRSHVQARATHAIAAERGDRVLLYEDVALEVLTCADSDRARSFVADELGCIAGPGSRNERLRETLATYFASSLNAAAAGAALGVHDQTVTYRLRQVETLLGYPIYTRRVELELAVRLVRVLK